jgi:AhpD family alkylhydroperoxidase
MFDNIEEIEQTRKKFNGSMFRSSSRTFKGFEELEARTLADGALSQKHKELIALGISVCEKCYGCIEYHVAAALEHGATREEIEETAAVAVCLGGGIAEWPARFVFKMLEDLEEKER